MLLKNFKPNASKIKAKTTFMEFNHPPDFGSFFKADGKIASNVNGAAKANPKKDIPIRGRIPPTCTASIMRAPINGPVHEKDTITVVRAIKKAPTKPPCSAFESVLFTRLPGSIISKAPKNDIAKTTKRIKNKRFGIQCVLKILPILGPNKPKVNKAPNKANINNIDSPKNNPLRIANFLLSLPLMKNETVIGIIGNTQGVRIAAKPARAEIRMNNHKVCPPDETGVDPIATDSESSVPLIVLSALLPPLKANSNSASLGGKHISSSHPIKRTCPVIFTGASSLSLIF